MFKLLNRLWPKPKQSKSESIDSLPRNIATSQKSLETEQARYLLPSFGIIPPFDLNTYLSAYVEDSLSYGLVQADVNLTVSEFEFLSPDDDVNDYLRDFHRRCDMDRVIWEVARDVSLFGFCAFEIVGNGPTLLKSSKVLAVRRIDPRFILIQKDQYGRIEFFRQRPLSIMHVTSGQLFDIPLDPQSIVYAHSLSPLTAYGQSLLQPLMVRIEQRNELIDAMVEAHKKHANPVNWIMYLGDRELGEVDTEINKQISTMNSATKAIDDNKSRWLMSAGVGTYDYKKIGAESLPESANLLKELTQDIITSAGFNPILFGLSEGRPSTESSRYTVNSIITRQRNLMSQIHAKLYSILPFVESDCPADSAEEIVVRMKAPDETTLKERLEAESIKINNVGLKLRMGAISSDQAALELGIDEWNDEQLLGEWVKSPDLQNKNDPNQVQQTRKSLDSLNNGKSPSNNPSGQKGNSQ